MVRSTRIVEWNHISVLLAAVISVFLLCGSVNCERSTSNPSPPSNPNPVPKKTETVPIVTTKPTPSKKPASRPAVAFTPAKAVKPTTAGPSISRDDCDRTRKLFVMRNLNYGKPNPPRDPVSGASLTVCNSPYTCCNRRMEQVLYSDMKPKVRSNFQILLRKSYVALEHREAQLTNYLHKLLNNSYRQLHKMFIQTYGLHYNRNSQVFVQFYTRMHEYLRGRADNVGEMVDNLFKSMGKKMITMLHLKERMANAAYRRSSNQQRTINCLNSMINKMNAYGKTPNDIKKDLIRSLTAGRTLAMVLGVQREVVAQVMKKTVLTPECYNALTRVNHCAMCVGTNDARACPNFCENVVRGCFAVVWKISDDWTALSNRALKLVNLLDGRNSLEHIFENSLSVKISEAITNFQTNFERNKPKLYNRCRAPYRIRRSAEKSKRRRRRRASGLYPRRGFNSGANQPQLKRLLTTLKNEVLAPQRRLWAHAVDGMCKRSPLRTSASASRCWNGTANGPYEGALVPLTVQGQASNPEVAVDLNRIPVVMASQVKLLQDAQALVTSAIAERETKHLSFSNTDVSDLGHEAARPKKPFGSRRNRNRQKQPTLPEASGAGPLPSTAIQGSGDGEPTKKTGFPTRPIESKDTTRPETGYVAKPPIDDEYDKPPTDLKTPDKGKQKLTGGAVEGSGVEASGAYPDLKGRQDPLGPKEVLKPEPSERKPETPVKKKPTLPPPKRELPESKPERKQPTVRAPIDDENRRTGAGIEGSGGQAPPEDRMVVEPGPRPQPDPKLSERPVPDWNRGRGRPKPRPVPLPIDQEENGSGDVVGRPRYRSKNPWGRPLVEEGGSGGSGMAPPPDQTDQDWAEPREQTHKTYPNKVWLPKKVTVIGGQVEPTDPKYKVRPDSGSTAEFEAAKCPSSNPKCNKAPATTAVNNLLLLLTVALLSAALLV